MFSMPSTSTRTLKRGINGVPTYTLQRSLNRLVVPTAADGLFGPATEQSVKDFQARWRLTVDGIAGQITQSTLIDLESIKQEVAFGLPQHLLKGIWLNEGAGYVGLVNQVTPGSRDGGAYQFRVVEADYDDWLVVQDAFDVRVSATKTARGRLALRDQFLPMLRSSRLVLQAPLFGVSPSVNRAAWELAVLDHNWPSAAVHLARGETAWLYLDSVTHRIVSTSEPAGWIERATEGVLHTAEEWIRNYIAKSTAYVDW